MIPGFQRQLLALQPNRWTLPCSRTNFAFYICCFDSQEQLISVDSYYSLNFIVVRFELHRENSHCESKV